MRQRTLLLGIGLLISTSICAEAQTPPPCSAGLRGRPIIDDGTVLSDRHTPLRGPRWSVDTRGLSPDLFDHLVASRQRGFNVLHVYTENAGDDPSEELPPGYRLAEMDQLVTWTDRLGLYLVMTVGGGMAALDPPDPELDRRFRWALGFWDLYADRYEHCPHVLYEIQNEPGTPGDLLFDGKRQFQADAYHQIRQVAPQTPVLLFSYNWINHPIRVRANICAVEAKVCRLRGKPASVCDLLEVDPGCLDSPEIDWTRSAIAFHGYAGSAITRTTLEAITTPQPSVRFPGYPAIETELSTLDLTDDLEPSLIELYETTRTSWLAFVRVDTGERQLEDVVDCRDPTDPQCEKLLWAADYGVWPGFSNPPVGSVLSLVAQENQRLVRVDSSQSGRPLVADGLGSSRAQNFKVTDAGLGRVALLAMETGLYVRALNGSLVATGIAPFAFEWIDRPDGKVALLATDPWQYTSPNLDLSASRPPLQADEPRGGEDEQSFVVAPPAHECSGLRQAEDGHLHGAFEETTEAGVTFAWVPDVPGSGAQPPADGQRISLCLQAPAAGTYRIKTRVHAPSHGANSFWVRIDGQPASPHLWVPSFGGWVVDYVSQFQGADPLEFSLSAGNHIVDFLLREDGTRLDWASLELVSQLPSLQSGAVTANQSTKSVALSGFSSPVVVFGPPSFVGPQPCTLRVSSVTGSSAQYRVQEWDYLDGVHANESVGYLAVQGGRSVLGSLAMEAGSRPVNHQWVTVLFQQPFPQIPVVIPQVVSTVDGAAVTLRIRNVTSTSFQIQLQEEQASDNVHAFETVHWIAIEPGQTTAQGRSVAVVRSGALFTDAFRFVSFGTSLAAPTFVAAQQTRNGSDTATLRHRNVLATGVELKVEEEQSLDGETGHVPEVVGLVAIGQ